MKTDEFDKLMDLSEDMKTDGDKDMEIDPDHDMEIDMAAEKTLHKKINRQINRRIFKGVLITLAAIALAVVSVSKFLDLIFYDPFTPSPENQQVEGFPVTDFNFLMDIYTGLSFPGTFYLPCQESATSQGFGSYTIPAGIRDQFYPLSIDGRSNLTFTIKKGKLSIDAASSPRLLTKTVNQFYHPSASGKENPAPVDPVLKITEEKKEEIRQLPDSAILKTALSFPESRSMEDTLEFINHYPDSTFSWIPVDSQKMFIGNTYDGIRLHTPLGYELTEETKEIYPSLLPDPGKLTPEILEECYLSRTKLLEDNPDFLKLLSTFFGPYPGPAYLENPDNQIKKPEDVKAIGVYGYVTKNDFLTMIESGEIPYAFIEDVKLSSFSKQ